MKIYITILYLFFVSYFLNASEHEVNKKAYDLSEDFIDVVIVSHEKDQETLNDCIAGIKENCNRVRRVIVISAKQLTRQAEWFDEKQFPFNKKEIALAIAHGDLKRAEAFSNVKGRGPGWYFQQLMKLYASFVIPDISSNVLAIDADTIFLNSVDFLNESGGGLFCVSYEQPRKSYLQHAKKLIPGYERIHPEFYSVCHHMLFQKPILSDLFKTVEKRHKTQFWKAFCNCVNLQDQGASEYEIYYNFALTHTDQVQIRELKWTNSSHPDEMNLFKMSGYHFVSFHTYMRGKWPRTFPIQNGI